MFCVGILQTERHLYGWSHSVEGGGTLFVIQIYSHELTEKGKEKQESRAYPFDKTRKLRN